MKSMKKLLALALVLVMLTALGVTALAADDGSITITPPTGLQSSDTTTYKIYKVFDATVNADDTSKVSYKLCSGDTLTPAMEAAGFAVDNAGNVTFSGSMAATGSTTDAAIAAIAAYVTEADLVATVTTTGSNAVTASDLAYGYYYITTTTGSLVTIDTTNIAAKVVDKNSIPDTDKVISATDPDYGSYDDDGKKALAQVGTDVEFTATITVGKGAKGYVFHDKMDTTLAYKNDVSVDPAASVDNTTTASGDTITITFKDSWLAANEGETITITYHATVTSDALQDNPAKNTATLDFGEGYTTEEDSTEVYNAKISVLKQDDKKVALPGAGFVLMNADKEYYKLENGVVTWVATEEEADEHVSDAQGAVPAFTGLADGTYTLVEKTVPEGYNKAADTEVTIAKGDYTAGNLKQEKTIENKAGTVLPSTGGIGTTLFYVFGTLLVLGAGVVLVTKRRVQE